MIRKQFLFLFFIPFLFSCYNENKVVVEKPDPFLDRQTMVEILTDIQIAEGIISHNRKERENTNNEYKDSLYQRLFDQYHISSKVLKENIHYYNVDPSVMEKIYDDVLARLSSIQSDILMDTTRKEMDTIRKEDVITDTLAE